MPLLLLGVAADNGTMDRLSKGRRDIPLCPPGTLI
jgi:hypothetical protein